MEKYNALWSVLTVCGTGLDIIISAFNMLVIRPPSV